jgi:hypothetical protein
VAVGVPVITQALEILKPAGRAGEELQAVGVPPELVGVVVDMASRRTNVTEEGVKLMLGAVSLVVILMFAVPGPTALVAVIV